MLTSVPKQFLTVDEKPIFIYTVEAFLRVSCFDTVLLVIHPEYKEEYLRFLKQFGIDEKINICAGGESRQESVYNAAMFLKPIASADDIVVIHDGARPCVSSETILENIALCQETSEPVSTVLPVVDTMIRKPYQTIDRDGLYTVQTPQTFRFSQILSLHESARARGLKNISDDAQLATLSSLPVHFAKGSRKNFKITSPEDLEIFGCYIRK